MNMTLYNETIIYEPYIVIEVAKVHIHKNMLLVCTRWTKAIISATASLYKSIEAASPRDLAPVFYSMMTFKQKVLLPNLLLRRGQVVSTLPLKYTISWKNILTYCAIDSSFIKYVLGLVQHTNSHTYFPINTVEYYHRLFALHEQFRAYIFANTSSDVMALLPGGYAYMFDYITDPVYGMIMPCELYNDMIGWVSASRFINMRYERDYLHKLIVLYKLTSDIPD